MLNVSNRENLTTDSGYIFYSILAPFFCKNANKFTFVSPEPLPFEKVENIKYDFGKTKYEVRFSFDWEKIEKIILKTKPDILLLNQIELIPNYKILLKTLGLEIPVIGYAHYIPYHVKNYKTKEDPSLNAGDINKSIKLNFISGLEAADKIFVHSKTALHLIKVLYNELGIKFVRRKFIINPPPCDKLFYEKPSRTNYSKIVYNHRLYSHYGTDFLLDLIKQLKMKDKSLAIHVFDILNKRTPIRQRLDSSVDQYRQKLQKNENVFIDASGNIREVYKQNMKDALCCLAPYRRGCPWSMSCVDAMALGIPCVAPDFDWFKEFIPTKLRFKTPDEAVSIILRLKEDPSFRKEMAKMCGKKTKALAPEKIAGHFLKEFSKLINK